MYFLVACKSLLIHHLFYRFHHWCFGRFIELKGNRYLNHLVLAEIDVVGDWALVRKVEHEIVQDQAGTKGDMVPIPLVTVLGNQSRSHRKILINEQVIPLTEIHLASQN